MGSGAKSYIRKGFLIYEEIRNFIPYMRRPLVIYDFAPDPSEFPYIWEKFYFLFLSGWGGSKCEFFAAVHPEAECCSTQETICHAKTVRSCGIWLCSSVFYACIVQWKVRLLCYILLCYVTLCSDLQYDNMTSMCLIQCCAISSAWRWL
jgi:hypothetical protein